jgi:hypothetical protein
MSDYFLTFFPKYCTNFFMDGGCFDPEEFYEDSKEIDVLVLI